MKQQAIETEKQMPTIRQNSENTTVRGENVASTLNNYTVDIQAKYIKAANTRAELAKKKAEIIAKSRVTAFKVLQQKRVIALVLDAAKDDQDALAALAGWLQAIAEKIVPSADVSLDELANITTGISERKLKQMLSPLLQGIGLVVKNDDGKLRYANLPELELAAGCVTRRVTRCATRFLQAGNTVCKVGVAHVAGCVTQSPYVTIDKNGNVTRYERFEQTEKGKESRRRLEAAKRDEDMARREMLAKMKADQMRNGIDPYITTGQFASTKTWMWAGGILALLVIAASANNPNSNKQAFPVETANTTAQIEHGE